MDTFLTAPRPNNALQRTGRDGGRFSAFQALLRPSPPLSLEALGEPLLLHSTIQTIAPNMRTFFLILFTLVALARGEAQSADASDAKSVVGAFYISVDDAATVYVNGNKFYAAKIGESHSPEMTLKTGDRIVVHLRDNGGGRHFFMLFASPDGKNVVSFRSFNFKTVPLLDATDFTSDQYESWKQYAKSEKFKNPLPIRSNSESLWGDLSKCIVACIVKPQMFSPRPQ